MKASQSVKGKYELTPEHRAQLPAWRDLWIDRIMSTAAMTDEEKRITLRAMAGLYAAAELTPPPQHRIVFVRSPFVARFAGGFAAHLWGNEKNRERLDALRAPATSEIEWATRMAIAETPREIPRSYDPDPRRSYDYWYLYPGDPRDDAQRIGPAKQLLTAARDAGSMWNGGNQWGQWPSLVSFFRHVAKLGIDYSKWAHYEDLAIHSGPRVMHARFCIVSDRPEKLTVDDANRGHCEDGPYCQWRDGSALYSIHGVRVPAWIVEFPDAISADKINAEPNAEVRRVMAERYGYGRYFQEGGSEIVDMDANPTEGGAPRMLIRDSHGDQYLVGTDGGTNRVYTMAAPRDARTCKAAHEALCGFDEARIVSEG